MTIQMRHCVRAAQRGDKIAAEELIKASQEVLKQFYAEVAKPK